MKSLTPADTHTQKYMCWSFRKQFIRTYVSHVFTAHLSGWSCDGAGGWTGRTSFHSRGEGRPWSFLSCELDSRDSRQQTVTFNLPRELQAIDKERTGCGVLPENCWWLRKLDCSLRRDSGTSWACRRLRWPARACFSLTWNGEKGRQGISWTAGSANAKNVSSLTATYRPRLRCSSLLLLNSRLSELCTSCASLKPAEHWRD